MLQQYLGITPYDEDNACIFVGRDDETWALYDRITRNDYTIFYAASGEGKSSLIKAGLLPILRRRSYFPVYIVFNDAEIRDVGKISAVIDDRIEQECQKHGVSYKQSGWSQEHFLPEVSEQLKSFQWWRLRNYCFWQEEREMKPLFIFDQFEEVFTKTNYDWTNSFFSWLESISTDYVPDGIKNLTNKSGIEITTQKNFKALFSFRTEYLGDLDYWCVDKYFLPSLQENRMCLKPMTPNGAERVIDLNKEVLGKYKDLIISGCSDGEPASEEKPCVYALILSVVCHTLSNLPEDERKNMLDRLNNDRDCTIDEILLKFYKDKLNSAGLNYSRDVLIVEEIENAFVDENGKRRRRNTGEASLSHIRKWIDILADKKNGLLKVVGRKEGENAEIVKTVELPHDRLCKAIDSSRKERQKRILWKMARQREWAQFGVLACVFGIVAYLINTMLPKLFPVIYLINSKKLKELLHYLFEYLKRINVVSTLEELGVQLSYNEAFSTLILMLLMLVFSPLLTFIYSSSKKSLKIVTSALSSLLFGWLCLSNRTVDFDGKLIQGLTFAGFGVSVVLLISSLILLKKTHIRDVKSNFSQQSLWPLWASLFVLAIYFFAEFLLRTTFGIPEPCDSCWALFVLPFLYLLWLWSYSYLKIRKEDRIASVICVAVSICSLISLAIVSYLPYDFTIKQKYGMSLSISVILLLVFTSFVLFGKLKSDNVFCPFTKTKKIFAIVFLFIIVTCTYLLNLGYNPFVVNPKKVCHVNSWHTVFVQERDTSDCMKYGKLYWDGETIVPYCIDSAEARRRIKGYTPYLTVYSNVKLDKSPWKSVSLLQYDYGKKKVKAEIYSHPLLDDEIRDLCQMKDIDLKSLDDSISHYSALLYKEILNANLHYLQTGCKYTDSDLIFLNILDSLQQVSLMRELDKLKDSVTVSYKENGIDYFRNCEKTEVLEDKHIVDLYRALSRKIVLCIIKDRAVSQDMVSLFNIHNYYMPAYFQCLYTNISFHQNFVMDLRLNSKGTDISNKIFFSSKELADNKLYAWVDFFDYVCNLEISLNAETFGAKMQSNSDKVRSSLSECAMTLQHIRDEQKQIANELEDIKKAPCSEASIRKLKVIKQSYDNLKGSADEINNMLESLNLLETVNIDESLQSMSKEVFEVIMPILEKKNNGLYNTAFEDIITNLVSISAFRGGDVEKDINQVKDYFDSKDDIISFFSEIISVSKSVQQLKKESVLQLKMLLMNISNSDIAQKIIEAESLLSVLQNSGRVSD